VAIETAPLQNLARRIRAHTVGMVHRANASHVGSCLSCADILAVLYGAVLRVDPARPDWDDRDRFVLSKGHAAAIVYATLAERGFFPLEWLETYCRDDSPLAGHITHYGVPGVEVSSGSLGHGLGIACGMSLRRQARAPALPGLRSAQRRRMRRRLDLGGGPFRPPPPAR